MIAELVYCIFVRDGRYEVSCLNSYENPGEYTGRYTGWKYDDSEKAEKIAYCLNHIHDPLAVKCFMELVGEQFT